MNKTSLFNDRQQAAWSDLIQRAVRNSVTNLGTMTGQDITATVVKPVQVEVTEIPEKLGGAGMPAVAVLLGIENQPGVHMALVHSPSMAFRVIDMLLGQEPGTTVGLGEMELSTLGEMGNVMCSAFLNTIGDTTEFELRPTPPTVRMDMIGALLDYALAMIMMEADEITLVETTYGTAAAQMEGTFVVMPSPALQADVLRSWGVA